MSHGHSRRNKHKGLSSEDLKELQLLRLQLLAVQIYFCSDIFFYKATRNSFEFLEYDFENIDNDLIARQLQGAGIQIINKYLISSALFGLINRIILGVVDFSRYEELEKKKRKGKIEFSLLPNLYIMLFDMLNIVAYSYILIGYIGLYEEEIFNFVQVFNKDYTRILLSVQEQAIFIRILGTCYLYESTLRSMELIMNKGNKSHGKPPSELSLEASECYLTARMMIEQINFKLFNKAYRDEDDILIVEAYRNIWQGNVYGVIANFQGLRGIVGIRERNVNQPIFGI